MLTLPERQQLDLLLRAIERRSGANFKTYFPDCLPGCVARTRRSSATTSRARASAGRTAACSIRSR
jgi:hypothetical protein